MLVLPIENFLFFIYFFVPLQVEVSMPFPFYSGQSIIIDALILHLITTGFFIINFCKIFWVCIYLFSKLKKEKNEGNAG